MGLKKLRVLVMKTGDGAMNMQLAQPAVPPPYAPEARPIYLKV